MPKKERLREAPKSAFKPGHKSVGGRTPGSKNRNTIAKEKALENYYQSMLNELGPITKAQQSIAQGLMVVLRPCLLMDPKTRKMGRTGELKRVIDPKEIEELFNSKSVGKDYHIVFAKDPNPKAIQDILDRLFGKAKEQVDINFKAKELKEIQDGIVFLLETVKAREKDK